MKIVCPCLQFMWSSLMSASMNGHKEAVKVLLSAGAKVDLLDRVRSVL